MNRFIVSIYNKFSQLINFCVKLFLLFRIWKRNSEKDPASGIYTCLG